MKSKAIAVALMFMIYPFVLRGQEDTTGNGQKPPSLAALLGLSIEELMDVSISSASKKAEKMSEAPATAYVVTQEDIRRRGYVFLKDVLRDLPGMETIENYFSEQGTLVAVRGVPGNNKIIVLVNGRRVNPPGGEEMMFRNDFNILEAKQIEVIYGLGSILYGQDAVSLVINVVTEMPGDKSAFDVMIRGGMYNSKEGVISYSRRISDTEHKYVGITASLSYADDDLSRIDKKYPNWWSKTYAQSIARTGIDPVPVRFDKGFNPFIRLESENSAIQVWHRESQRSSAEGGYYPVLQYTKEAIWHDRTTVISATNKLNLTDKLTIQSFLSYSRYEIDPETRYVFPVNDSTIVLNAFKYGIGVGARIEEQVDYQINKNVSLTTGVLVAFYDIIPKATIFGGADPRKDIKNQGGYISYYTRKGDSTSRVDLPNAYELYYNNYDVYAEVNYRISDKVKTVTGLRVDFHTRFAEIPVSPRLALIYNARKDLVLKYIYNRGYVAPAPYFSYNVFDNGQNLNTFNADLQAEHASSNELNITLKKKKLSLTSAFYYNKQQNLIVLEDGRISPANLVQDTVYMNPDGTGARELTKTANSGSSEAIGADIFGTYKGEHLAAWGSFSYVWFRQELSNNISHLHNISAVNIRLGVTWMTNKKFSFTPSLIFRSTPVDMPNTTGLENEIINPYSVNFHGIYNPTDRFSIFIDGTNITNHKYALKGVITPSPQEPIRLLAGLRYTIR